MPNIMETFKFFRLMDEQPPDNIIEATKTFYDRHDNILAQVAFFSVNSSSNDETHQVQQYYEEESKYSQLSALSILLTDIAFISFISAHVQLQLEDQIISVQSIKSIVVCGHNGAGKDETLWKHRVRTQQLSKTFNHMMLWYMKNKHSLLTSISFLVAGYVRYYTDQFQLHIPKVIIDSIVNYYFVPSNKEDSVSNKEIQKIQHLWRKKMSFSSDYSWNSERFEEVKFIANLLHKNSAYRKYIVYSKKNVYPVKSLSRQLSIFKCNRDKKYNNCI